MGYSYCLLGWWNRKTRRRICFCSSELLSFHNKLPKTNKNKIPEGLLGIRLHSRLYVRAKDLCKDIPFDAIDSEKMLTGFPKQYINEMLFQL